jgi:hypothetical protein
MAIVDAMNSFGGTGLWDEQDGKPNDFKPGPTQSDDDSLSDVKIIAAID